MTCRTGRRRFASRAVVLLAAAALSSTVGAQELPSAQEVIARHVEAVGGRAAIERHSSLHATGVVEILGQGLVGELEIYSAAPDKALQLVRFSDVGVETSTGYDGEVGWSLDTMTGERLLEGGELQQLVDESDFYADLHDPEKFESMETVGVLEFDGRTAHEVKLVYLSGREVVEYFDVETGRMIGVRGAQETLMGSINVVTYLREYRDFAGVMLPVTMVQSMGAGQRLQLTIESVDYDVVDPAVFELPAAIKALIG